MQKSVTILPVLVSLLMLMMGCHLGHPTTGDGEAVPLDAVAKVCQWPVSAQRYHRDSSCIVWTAVAWIHKGVSFYKNWRDSSGMRDVCITVDTIFYDSTHTKLYSILCMGYDRTTVADLSNDYPDCRRLYDSRAMIGFLDSAAHRWRLFDPDIYLGTAWCDSLALHTESYEALVTSLPQRLISRTIKNQAGKTVGVTEPLRYGPVHCKFWTDSPLWKHGYRLPGYYPFEVHQNAGPVFPKSIKEVIEVPYPDSLAVTFESD